MGVMNELIKVTENDIGERLVSARDLYEFLEIKTQFTDWCKRMFEYGFVENQDYVTITQKKVTAQGNQSQFTDYALTLDCAKEISMIQRSDKGKQARQYFLDIEKKYLEMQKNLSPAEILVQQAQRLLAQERKMLALETKVHEIDAKLTTIDEDYYGLAGYYKLKGRKFDLTDTEAQQAGKQLTAKSKELCYPTNKTYSAKHGAVNTYHKDILQKVLGF